MNVKMSQSATLVLRHTHSPLMFRASETSYPYGDGRAANRVPRMMVVTGDEGVRLSYIEPDSIISTLSNIKDEDLCISIN